MPKSKVKKKGKEEEQSKTIKKIAEFTYAYPENAQRIAFAHALSCHFVKIKFINSAYVVEIYA